MWYDKVQQKHQDYFKESRSSQVSKHTGRERSACESLLITLGLRGGK